MIVHTGSGHTVSRYWEQAKICPSMIATVKFVVLDRLQIINHHGRPTVWNVATGGGGVLAKCS